MANKTKAEKMAEAMASMTDEEKKAFLEMANLSEKAAPKDDAWKKASERLQAKVGDFKVLVDALAFPGACNLDIGLGADGSCNVILHRKYTRKAKTEAAPEVQSHTTEQTEQK